jgi:dTMP kinase
MLFAAAREDHVSCTIEPALAAGKWVVCDRFADSTRVYQGALGQVDRRLIKGLERVSIGDLLPDLTLILDVPVDVALERRALRRGNAPPDRFEAENVEFHEKLREAFCALAAEEPERCVIIDASVPRVQVAKDIWDTVQAKLDPATAPLAQDVPAPETLVS